MTSDAGEPGRIRTWLRRDRGQLSVEFTGMVPIILVTLVLLWQAVLVGYTFTLASGAADEGVRKAVAAGAWDMRSRCQDAVNERLPGAWEGSADVSCEPGSDMVKATVRLETPVLFPGFASLPIPVTATAGAAAEGN
ncbi:TadE family protein [Streptomyces sp. QL37]|uniref:TadE family protein n=1 Tax=Streptomyces sp. QL37 TaxID=2093747 RepID=UPI000CF2550A|nr:TadE family protein [Streptomyces sp. QL37]PPQ59424.1 septum formation initiator [Streptomyces sp. QL37]